MDSSSVFESARCGAAIFNFAIKDFDLSQILNGPSTSQSKSLLFYIISSPLRKRESVNEKNDEKDHSISRNVTITHDSFAQQFLDTQSFVDETTLDRYEILKIVLKNSALDIFQVDSSGHNILTFLLSHCLYLSHQSVSSDTELSAEMKGDGIDDDKQMKPENENLDWYPLLELVLDHPKIFELFLKPSGPTLFGKRNLTCLEIACLSHNFGAAVLLLNKFAYYYSSNVLNTASSLPLLQVKSQPGTSL